MNRSNRIRAILGRAKKLAQEYEQVTGKPLGITGEVAEYEAARLLKLQLTDARCPGFDAVEKVNGRKRRLQIKGRRLAKYVPGARVGKIDLSKDWDAVILVLLDEKFDATKIFEAPRTAIEKRLKAPGSKARNERGQLAIAQFKSIAKLRWSRT